MASYDSYFASIDLWPGSWAPANWSLCAGQQIPAGQNQALYALIGGLYGTFSSSSFFLPDLRGRAAMGFGHGPGTNSYNQGATMGKETNNVQGYGTVKLTADNLPGHTHPLTNNAFSGSATIQASNANADTATPTAGSAKATALDSGNQLNTFVATGTATAIAPYAVNGSLSGSTGPNISTQTAANAALDGTANLMQPFLAINYIICVDGYWPPNPN